MTNNSIEKVVYKCFVIYHYDTKNNYIKVDFYKSITKNG